MKPKKNDPSSDVLFEESFSQYTRQEAKKMPSHAQIARWKALPHIQAPAFEVPSSPTIGHIWRWATLALALCALILLGYLAKNAFSPISPTPSPKAPSIAHEKTQQPPPKDPNAHDAGMGSPQTHPKDPQKSPNPRKKEPRLVVPSQTSPKSAQSAVPLQNPGRQANTTVSTNPSHTLSTLKYPAPSACHLPASRFKYAELTLPKSLHPSFIQTPAGMHLRELIFDRLVTIAPNGQPIAGLAESWTLSRDAKSITLFLRHNAFWHDGVPFTAHDVAFTLRLQKQAKTVTPYQTLGIRHIQLLSRWSVRITFSSPQQNPLPMLQMEMLPQHRLGTQQAIQRFHKKPIGTGPFRVVRWVGRKIVLALYNLAWRSPPVCVKRVYFQAIPDLNLQREVLLYGGIDAVTLLRQSDIQLIKKNPKHRLQFVISAKHPPNTPPNQLTYSGFSGKIQNIHVHPLYFFSPLHVWRRATP